MRAQYGCAKDEARGYVRRGYELMRTQYGCAKDAELCPPSLDILRLGPTHN